MNSILSGLYPALKDILFPAACLLCHKGLGKATGILLCPDCLAQIPLIGSPLCICCGKEFPNSAPGDHLCGVCQRTPPYFDQARAIFRFNKHTAPLLYSFKYKGQTTAQKTFMALMEQVSAIESLSVPDIIIPVPLHKKRLQERGFNQALELARLFFPQQKKCIRSTLLWRNRNTTSQTKLNGIHRRKNLAGAFQVKDQSQVQGQKIILVDDVLTTGTTVNECAKVLRQNGARSVQVLTLARVLE